MIDWDRVQELRSDFGEEDFVEIVTMFLGEVELKIEEMLGGMSDAELSEGFHFVKGSAANLGFKALQELAAEGEKSPGQEHLTKLSELFIASRGSFESQLDSGAQVA
jgi:HPt (histidine-containing phosphotransfer) domain-containing protein